MSDAHSVQKGVLFDKMGALGGEMGRQMGSLKSEAAKSNVIRRNNVGEPGRAQHGN